MGLKNIKQIGTKDIYERYNDNDLFSHYFGNFKFGKCYPSVFRKDANPSTGFYVNRNGKIIYNDITTSEKLDVFAFVGKKYMLSYYDAVKKVASDFNIQPSTEFKDTKEIKKIIHTPEVKKETTIDIIYKKWDEEALGYWKQFHINKWELEDNEVYNVKKLLINGVERPNHFNDLQFAYVLEYKNKFYKKIYQPYGDKSTKWKTNCPIYIPFGYNKLTYSTDTLVVCKSVKEMIILKKFFPDVIAVQNESPASLRDTTLERFKKRYKFIYLFFDIDEPGLKAAEYYKEKGLIPVHLPLNLVDKGIKDTAEFVAEYGLDRYRDFLKHKNLI